MVVIITFIKLYNVLGVIDDSADNSTHEYHNMKVVTPINDAEPTLKNKLLSFFEDVSNLHPEAALLKLKEKDPAFSLTEFYDCITLLHIQMVSALHHEDLSLLKEGFHRQVLVYLRQNHNKAGILALPISSYDKISIRKVWSDDNFDYLEVKIVSKRLCDGDINNRLVNEKWIVRRPLVHDHRQWQLYHIAEVR